MSLLYGLAPRHCRFCLTQVQTSSPWLVTLSWQHSCINNMTYKPTKLG